MSRQRRTFTAQFKRETARLVLEQDYGHAEAAKSLDMVESTPAPVGEQAPGRANGITLTSKAMTPEQQKSRPSRRASTD